MTPSTLHADHYASAFKPVTQPRRPRRAQTAPLGSGRHSPLAIRVMTEMHKAASLAALQRLDSRSIVELGDSLRTRSEGSFGSQEQTAAAAQPFKPLPSDLPSQSDNSLAAILAAIKSGNSQALIDILADVTLSEDDVSQCLTCILNQPEVFTLNNLIALKKILEQFLQSGQELSGFFIPIVLERFMVAYPKD